MEVKELNVNRFISKSEIKGIDFVINSYVGCPNGCMYCYASFMKNLTKHNEEWGEFIDIKLSSYKLKSVSVTNKTYLMSSTTDCYNLYEEKYKLTRNILSQLVNFDFNLIIETKNKLILRDLDLLKKFKNLKVVISLNTLDDKVRCDLEKYSSIESRIETLKELSKNNIYTILNIAPIMPYLTDYKKIIAATKDYVKEYHFAFLELKNDTKRKFLKYINDNYKEYYLEYAKIYLLNDNNYFTNLKIEIENYCKNNNIKYSL